ncbi:DNA directed RNA polymerase subunit delta [Williamsoniiplasma somnilux]|uniref:RNAP delta factor n=1 Tax=Williamsoniiplasma somnilux TaxID=215578 RepID=A0A2K8NXA4_9MOLU|nr:DNA-directed RNA polymerase subunit delta [Williamsoniiplasma somnilux]ATZ18475.1 DNA directed RNA polymerase subunit delta [Williamsoniiplasma somnilux]
MAKLSNINAAYEFLKAKKNKAKFEDISKAVLKQNKIESNQKDTALASLYSSLVLDNRFSLTPDGSWALKGNLKFEDVKKQYANLIFEPVKKKVEVEEIEESEEEITDIIEEDLENDDEEIEEDEEDEEIEEISDKFSDDN